VAVPVKSPVLITRHAPPAQQPPFPVRQKAMQPDAGRPLEPQQMNNLRGGKPAGPPRDPEIPAHPAAPITRATPAPAAAPMPRQRPDMTPAPQPQQQPQRQNPAPVQAQRQNQAPGQAQRQNAAPAQAARKKPVAAPRQPNKPVRDTAR
jgi:hypothetical protein